MTHKLEPKDFRAHRKVLDPSDFSLGGDSADLPSTSLISEEIWDGFMTLPTDVVITTTNHQGKRIELMYELWSGWGKVSPHDISEGIIFEAMWDIADDFDAALFNIAHGFYKQAIMSFRSALELMVFACDCELEGDVARWDDWKKGNREINFQRTCEAMNIRLSDVESAAQMEVKASVFPSDNSKEERGAAWATNLYRRLCEYSHPRGTNAGLWSSNGPVYSTEGMRISFNSYLETYALLILLAKIARGETKMPAEATIIFESDSIDQYMGPQFRGLCAFYKGRLFQ